MFAVFQAFEQFSQGFAFREAGFDGVHQGKAPAQLHELPRIHLAGGYTAQDAFHVPQLAKVHLGIVQNLRILGEVLHAVVAGLQFLAVQDGHGQPGAEHAGAHGAGALVQGLHQRHAVGPGSALEHLQVAEGETVHPHKFGLVNAADGANVFEAYVLGLFQVHQQRAGTANAQRVRVDGKAFEAVHAQLPFEALHGGIVHKGPFVNGSGEIVPQALLEAFFVAALHYQFLGLEGAQEGPDVVQIALCNLKLAGGNIQEGGAAAVFFHREAAEEVVLLDLQHVFPEGDAGRNNLCYTAFDQFFGEFRVLQLVADGHFEAGPHQLGEVIFQRMMRKAGHGHGTFVSVGLFGLDQPEHPHGRDGIVRVALVKVSHAVQQDGLRVLCFHLKVMPQHGGIFRYFCHCVVLYAPFRRRQRYNFSGKSPIPCLCKRHPNHLRRPLPCPALVKAYLPPPEPTLGHYAVL